MEDLSDDELSSETTVVTSQELQQRLKDAELERSFRKWSFWGVAVFTSAYLLCFLVWVCILLLGFIRHPSFMDHGNHLWTLCLILLAVIPTTMALALLRFAFRGNEERKKEKTYQAYGYNLPKKLLT